MSNLLAEHNKQVKLTRKIEKAKKEQEKAFYNIRSLIGNT